MASGPRFHRALLKLSGEQFREGDDAFAPSRLAPLADVIQQAQGMGVQLAIVVGGGNLLRGRDHAASAHRADVDQVGMLATVMNVAMLRLRLEERQVPCRLYAPRQMHPVALAFDRRAAVAALEEGRVVLLGGGTGNPFFSTDSAAALRAAELGCDVVLKASNVDGVYDKDPRQHPDARRYDTLTFDEALARDLKVMDATAFAICREQDVPIVVFDVSEPQNLLKVLDRSLPGTLVHGNGS